MSLSYRHQQLVCYQLSKSESLVKGIQTAKIIYNSCIYVVDIIHFDMHTGHQCKVNELEYGELLLEACSLVNTESKLHRYLAYTYAGELYAIGSHGYKYREPNMWKDLL